MLKPAILLVTFLFVNAPSFWAQEMEIQWTPREDLNILLPSSIKVFDTYGKLSDGAPLRAMYAVVDLRDENLKLRALGSNKIRQTTLESLEQSQGILAINGGYFSATSSVSVLISDGDLIAPGHAGESPRGAFGLNNGEPQIGWTSAKDSQLPYKYETPVISENKVRWNPSQSVGGGPVLIKNGKINVTSEEEGFSGSHLQRHPRTAIGYKDKNTLILFLADGRQMASAGVTLPELAELMLNIGAQEALNLDGGGSSAMIAAGEVVNVPSDITGGNRNSLRKNASALILSEIAPSSKPTIYHYDTDLSSYSEKGVWKNSNQVNYYGKTPSRIALSESKLNKAQYSFNDIVQSNYQLAIWYTVNPDENTSKAVYVVHQNTRKDTIELDQTNLSHTGKWRVLGNFLLGKNDKLEILSGGTKGKLVTDAIRLVAEKNSPEIPQRGDMRIAVISDLNSGLGSSDYEWQVDSIIQRIPRVWKPDLVISGGDMVAGMGINDTLQLQKMWDGFNTHIAKPLKNSNIPFAFTLGNHDGPRSHPVERIYTQKYWNQPGIKPRIDFVDGTHFPDYYSFTMNDIFFVSWDASSSEITEENLVWMQHQFDSEKAKNAKLRFVMGHMPLYSSAQERDSQGNVLARPEELRKLLEENNVHTYISGHQHAYYPAKRGALELLNTGATGTGERSWLGMDKEPVNTITILDIFHEKDTVVYSTYNIKEKNASEMRLFDQKDLPSAMFGVNGHMLRRDILPIANAKGKLSAFHIPGNLEEKGTGIVSAKVQNNHLLLAGKFSNVTGKLSNISAALYKGRNTEAGEFLTNLKIRKKKNSGTFEGKVILTDDLRDFLSIGALYVQINTNENPTGALRGHLYPDSNQSPSSPQIVSHNSRNVYGIRDLEALYEIEWKPSEDVNGDYVSYTYQLAKDENFKELIFQKKTGRSSHLKLTERDWFKILTDASFGATMKFHHRVVATDGSNLTTSASALLQLMKTNEPLEDLSEILSPEYEFSGKIADADGSGYGAQWDKAGKLWLADYNRGLIIKRVDGSNADFSPLTNVEVNGETYHLKPLSGLGVDNDGNILVSRNRHLIKINSNTGEGIAAWEVPVGKRAITSPRVSEIGEIYAMSLFAEDGNYILRASEKKSTTFDLVRTIELTGRNLSRTFDMTADGKNLYFPDPGSPIIQHYTSEDGKNYKKEKDISSLSAGSSAIQIVGKSVYVATRSSGISPSTFHYRNEVDQRMWTMELPEVNGAEPRGIGVSPDGKTLIFCSWDKSGGYYKYKLKE